MKTTNFISRSLLLLSITIILLSCKCCDCSNYDKIKNSIFFIKTSYEFAIPIIINNASPEVKPQICEINNNVKSTSDILATSLQVFCENRNIEKGKIIVYIKTLKTDLTKIADLLKTDSITKNCIISGIDICAQLIELSSDIEIKDSSKLECNLDHLRIKYDCENKAVRVVSKSSVIDAIDKLKMDNLQPLPASLVLLRKQLSK